MCIIAKLKKKKPFTSTYELSKNGTIYSTISFHFYSHISAGKPTQYFKEFTFR